VSVPSKSRAELAAIIGDYRAGEIEPPDAAHVDRWVSQFPADVRDAIVDEMIHVMSRTYFSRANFQTFIDSMVVNSNFAGNDPAAFWKGVQVLDLQTAGNSQKDMIALLDESLQRQCGIALAQCGAQPHTYIYLDDALFSGGRIRNDLVNWVKKFSPGQAKVAVLVIAHHRLGQWYSSKKIEEAALDAGKTIDIKWWRAIEIEDRKAYTINSDVLRPTGIPDDPATQTYIAEMDQSPIVRDVGGSSPLGVFSGEAGRHLLEQQFLTAGVRIRTQCPNLPWTMRPLGATLFSSFGFGSTIVTYRNCPNNAPLVFWVGHPWYPLFPRITN